MGLSGSGKSTMVRHLNRLLEPTSGQINVLGKDMMSLNATELRKMRAAHIGMVFSAHGAVSRTVRYAITFAFSAASAGRAEIKALGRIPALPQYGQPGWI